MNSNECPKYGEEGYHYGKGSGDRMPVEFTPLTKEDMYDQCRIEQAMQLEVLGHWEPLRNACDLSCRMTRTFGNPIKGSNYLGLEPTIEDMNELIDKIKELKNLIESEENHE
jgi:hypothetical protein